MTQMKNIVLLAEASTSYLDTLKNVVIDLGCTPYCCADGEQTIHAAHDYKDTLAAAIIDVHIDVIDGISVLGHIRNAYPDIPIIMLAHGDDAGDERVAMGLGAHAFILKNKPIDMVREALQKLLDSNTTQPQRMGSKA